MGLQIVQQPNDSGDWLILSCERLADRVGGRGKISYLLFLSRRSFKCLFCCDCG